MREPKATRVRGSSSFPSSSLVVRVFVSVASLSSASEAARFVLDGPSLTLTLQEDVAVAPSSSSSSSSSSGALLSRALDVAGLSPSLAWGVRSNGPPLPKRCPAWREFSLRAGRSFGGGARASGHATFFGGGRWGGLRVAPNWDARRGTCEVRVDAGTTTSATTTTTTDTTRQEGLRLSATLSTKKKTKNGTNDNDDDNNDGRNGGWLLRFAEAAWRRRLPFAAVSSVAVNPSFDFARSAPSCVLAAESGTGRTTTVLDLDWERPTLSLVHALDARNTVRPTISLHDARVSYEWIRRTSSGSILVTRVDPSRAVEATWTDPSSDGGGEWIVDATLPLRNVDPDRPFAADVRVRRRFAF